ncbi:unnamed protein product [Brassica oleracea]
MIQNLRKKTPLGFLRVPNCRWIKLNRKIKIREDNLNLSKYLRLSEKPKEFENWLTRME